MTDFDDDDGQELMAFRRQALLQLMRRTSESCWASGWHRGLDADLYRIAFEGASPEYGRGEVSIEDQALLREYAARADCWFSRVEKPVAIPLDEAKRRFERIRPHGVQGTGRTVREVFDLYEHSGPGDWIPDFETHEDDPGSGPALDFLFAARERHRYRHDGLIELVRRYDARFDLRYGEVDIRIVEPRWLSKEPPRAQGCTQERPCSAIRRCVWCAEARF